jgi:hypothetical protein
MARSYLKLHFGRGEVRREFLETLRTRSRPGWYDGSGCEEGPSDEQRTSGTVFRQVKGGHSRQANSEQGYRSPKFGRHVERGIDIEGVLAADDGLCERP